jgi:hypothetical protein
LVGQCPPYRAFDFDFAFHRKRKTDINGSGKEIKFPLTLTFSTIGGEGIKLEPLSCSR